MNTPRRWRALLALLGLAGLAAAGPTRAQPPLWVVHGAHGDLVLFGSVHLLPAGLDWTPPRLKLALNRTREVWFEIPLDPASALAASQIALQRGLLPAGQTLDAELPADVNARMARIARADGVSLEGLRRLRPWLAEITLSLADYRKSGAFQEDGVERRLARALPADVERRAFETPSDQIEALSAAPLSDQVASLEETLTEMEAGDKGYQRLVAAWMAGDVAALEREVLDPLMTRAPGVYRAMVVERNRRWIQAIRTRLATSGDAVMVVGVGHLIGPDSLPALLRAEGVAVEGP